MITLDASVVIAHLSPHDVHHDRASVLLRSATEAFWMHPLNLAEVLVGGVRAGRGQEMLDDLRAIGIDVVDPPGNESLRLATLRARTGLRLPDCCALDTAVLTGTALATFDDALANAARDRHVVVHPAVPE